MKKMFVVQASACLLIPALVLFGNPDPGRAIVMVDETTAYPSNSIATPSELQQLSNQIGPLDTKSTAAFNKSVGAYDFSEYAYNAIRFIDSSNIVVSTAYVPSVGTPASAGTNQTIRVYSMTASGEPTTNIHIVATFDKLQTVAPAVDWRGALTSGGAPGGWSTLTNIVCSWPDTVEAQGAETPFVYSFDIPAPAGTAAFFRVVSLDDGGAGSGYYFLVYNFISINGRAGWTGTATADDGTEIEFVGGLAVEPFSE